MTWRQLEKVPNGYIELSAKWAGSGKIPGCYKRMFQLSNISDNITENTRTANEYLNVSFNNKNNWIESEFSQKWDYWKFDFSPNKNKQIVKQKLEVIDKEVWKERWKNSSDTKIILLIEGTVQDIGGSNFILLNWSIFHRKLRILNLVGIDQEIWSEWGITPPNRIEILLNEGTIKTLDWKNIILINGSIFHRADIMDFYGLYSAKDDFLRCDQQDIGTEVKSNSDNSVTKYTEDNLSQFLSKMVDIETIRQAAQMAKAEQIELLQSQIERSVETVQDLAMQSGSEFMQYQKTQGIRDIRRDKRTVETKLRQLRNLRTDATRLAAGMTPPAILESSFIRDDL